MILIQHKFKFLPTSRTFRKMFVCFSGSSSVDAFVCFSARWVRKQRHTEIATFIWQIATINDILSPKKRKTCQFGKFPLSKAQMSRQKFVALRTFDASVPTSKLVTYSTQADNRFRVLLVKVWRDYQILYISKSNLFKIVLINRSTSIFDYFFIFVSSNVFFNIFAFLLFLFCRLLFNDFCTPARRTTGFFAKSPQVVKLKRIKMEGYKSM